VIIADIKGKLPELQNWEDYLTSCVFSSFKYLGDGYLERFLNTAHSLDKERLNISIANPKYDFWPCDFIYGKTLPDLIISTQEIALIIEAKFYSGKSGSGTEAEEENESLAGEQRRDHKILIDQLAREYYLGRKRSNNFYVVYITTDSIFPKDDIETTLNAIKEMKDKREVQRARKRIFWTKWVHAAQIMEDIMSRYDKTTFQYLLASDLLAFLEKRSLVGFKGFEFLSNYSEIFNKSDAKHIFYKYVQTKYWSWLEKYKNKPNNLKPGSFYT
jgi:hypothetical protein